MTLFKKRPLQLALAASLSALAACGGSSNGNGDGSNEGRLNLRVTDAPIDSAAQVVVEFSGVSLKPADGEALEFTFDEPKRIDLLSLQGSASESLLTDETVPAGDYEWIRLAVNAEHDGVLDSYIELTDGTMPELRVPSGSQSGLKLVSGFTVVAGGTANFTIDFDLRKSIVMPGGQAGAFLKPALRLIDNASVGTIAGRVDAEVLVDQCADPATQTGSVYVYSGTDINPTDVSGADTDPLTTALVADEDGEYRYEVGFVSEGDYTLAYTCGAVDDDPETVDELVFFGTSNAAVEADTTTEVNFTIDQAEDDTGENTEQQTDA